MKLNSHKILVLLLIMISIVSCDFKSAQTYYKEAVELAGENKSEEAIEKLDIAIKKEPKYRMAIIQRGYIKSEWLTDYKGGIKDFKQVLSFDPDNTLALYYIGYVYGEQQEHKKAVEYLNKAMVTEGVIKSVEINLHIYDGSHYDDEVLFKVDESDINYELGLQYVRLEQFDKAIENLNKSVKAKSHMQDSFFLLGEAYIAKKDTINACSNFKKSA